MWRELVLVYLGSLPGIEVLGQATTADQACQLVKSFRPDVVLVDWLLGGMDGVTLTRRFRAAVSGVRCLLVSAYPCFELIHESEKAGAYGVLSKQDGEAADLHRAIVAVHAGRPYYCARCSELFRSVKMQGAKVMLTVEERAVLVGLGDSLTLKEVAADLGVSVSTVGACMRRIAAKLNLQRSVTPSVLVAAARRAALLWPLPSKPRAPGA